MEHRKRAAVSDPKTIPLLSARTLVIWFWQCQLSASDCDLSDFSARISGLSLSFMKPYHPQSLHLQFCVKDHKRKELLLLIRWSDNKVSGNQKGMAGRSVRPNMSYLFQYIVTEFCNTKGHTSTSHDALLVSLKSSWNIMTAVMTNHDKLLLSSQKFAAIVRA